MNFQEQKKALRNTIEALPPPARDILGANQPDWIIEDSVSAFGITFEEIGSLCDAVRHAITDNTKDPEQFIETIRAALSEEHQADAEEIASVLNAQILKKLFPAFGKPIWNIILKPRTNAAEQSSGRQAISNVKTTTPAVSEYSAQFGKERTTPVLADSDTSFRKGGTTTPNPSLERRGGEILDERHLRALLRIAAGTTYTEQKLRESFEDLPQGLRQAITSVDTGNAVQDIAKKYMLHVDQMGALASETGLVLLGLTHPKDFVANLARRLRVPKERALEIGKEISAGILSKVREALRGLHETKPEIKKVTPFVGNTTPALADSGTPFGKGDTTTHQSPPWKGGGKTKSPQKFGVLTAQKETTPASPTLPVRTRRQVDTPFGKGDTTTPLIPSLEKEGKIRTPYSPEAKWNLGDEDEKSQSTNSKLQTIPNYQYQKEDKLTREEVLRGIENPSETQLKTSNLQLETKVGPTGWRQPVNHEAWNMKLETENIKREAEKVEHAPPKTFATHTPEPDEDLVEQKLGGPMSIPKTEQRYTTDPYRESVA